MSKRVGTSQPLEGWHTGSGVDGQLKLAIRLEKDGPIVAIEPVRAAALGHLRSEVWWNGSLRRGQPHLTLEDLQWRMGPAPPVASDDQPSGFVIESCEPGSGRTYQQTFPIETLAHVADAAAAELLLRGQLDVGQTYTYELLRTTREPQAASPDTPGLKIKTTSNPLALSQRDWPAIEASAQVVGSLADDAYPVVMTERALRETDRLSRLGGLDDPPTESGCLLAGELCLCPNTATVFVLVRETLPIDNPGEQFALSLSPAAWRSIDRSLRELQGQCSPTTPIQLLGQGHGHNFPLRGERCVECDRRPTCTQSTVFVSMDDCQFMRNVFARKPWALCWIAGTNARGEQVASLFTWRNGLLRPRGFHVIESHDGPGIESLQEGS